MKSFEKFCSGIHYLKNDMLLRISDLSGNILWKPNAFYIEITNKCACRCKQCDIYKNSGQEELATEQWKNEIQEINDWLSSYGLTISGGEPFLRKDLLDICEYAMKHGANIKILTNGMHLTEKIVKEVCRIGIQRMAFSVDGLGENHDYVRGVAGFFEHIHRTIHLFNKYPQTPLISVATIITNRNITELGEMLDWIESHDLNGIMFIPLQQNFGSGSNSKKWHKESELWVQDYNTLCSTIDRLIDMRKAGRRIINPVCQLEFFKEYHKNSVIRLPEGLRCWAGRRSVGITVKGDVYFCSQLGAIGNVLENCVRKIWKSKEARMMHQRIQKCRLNCCFLNCFCDNCIIPKIYQYLKFY